MATCFLFGKKINFLKKDSEISFILVFFIRENKVRKNYLFEKDVYVKIESELGVKLPIENVRWWLSYLLRKYGDEL